MRGIGLHQLVLQLAATATRPTNGDQQRIGEPGTPPRSLEEGTHLPSHHHRKSRSRTPRLPFVGTLLYPFHRESNILGSDMAFTRLVKGASIGRGEAIGFAALNPSYTAHK